MFGRFRLKLISFIERYFEEEHRRLGEEVLGVGEEVHLFHGDVQAHVKEDDECGDLCRSLEE